MNTKNIILGVILIAIAFGIGYVGINLFNPPLDPVVTEGGDRVHEESTDLYTITAMYPNSTDPRMEAAITALIKEEIERFKSESVSLINEEEAERLRAANQRYQLIIEYTPHTASDFISYEFNVYLDTGGAHPNGFFRTLVFDTEGNEVALEDLFVPESNYLERLSTEAHERVLAELRERVGEVTPDMADTVRMGTAPSREALQFFYLTDTSLHLLFPPYQVAAYAAGSFDIAIPLEELEDILK